MLGQVNPVSDSDYINELFKIYAGRDALASDIAFWQNALNSGSVTRAQMPGEFRNWANRGQSCNPDGSLCPPNPPNLQETDIYSILGATASAPSVSPSATTPPAPVNTTNFSVGDIVSPVENLFKGHSNLLLFGVAALAAWMFFGGESKHHRGE